MDGDLDTVFRANITVDDDNVDSSSSQYPSSKEQRTYQSEKEFQEQKENWTPKVDTKDVHSLRFC